MFKAIAGLRIATIASVAVLAGPALVSAQQARQTLPSLQPQQAPQPLAAQAATKPAPQMDKLSGVWVEGAGFEITYGNNYDACAQKCLSNQRCVMIEYYRPEKKCNLYDTLRPRKTGGSSDVAIRR